ncbi:serine/threonine-protein kinase pim-3-like isoform X3 [Lepisosteus oculatus]|uniref:serine/threonine-protein kinase pim-3-like isoform X3 n=1 Tax=Lepisosteus oculatus TaxID=7918 RepID=UPI0035F51C4A
MNNCKDLLLASNSSEGTSAGTSTVLGSDGMVHEGIRNEDKGGKRKRKRRCTRGNNVRRRGKTGKIDPTKEESAREDGSQGEEAEERSQRRKARLGGRGKPEKRSVSESSGVRRSRERAAGKPKARRNKRRRFDPISHSESETFLETEEAPASGGQDPSSPPVKRKRKTRGAAARRSRLTSKHPLDTDSLDTDPLETSGWCEEPEIEGEQTTELKSHSKEVFQELYEKGDLIGYGGYGCVYAGNRKTDGIPVAVKCVYRKTIKKWANLQQGTVPLEIVLHQQVCAPPACASVVMLLDWFRMPDRFLLVLERPEPCQDLFNFLQDVGGFLEEPLARDFLRQAVEALLHCLSRGVVHRDLKPENLLVEARTQRLKLIDFGSASPLQDGLYSDLAGTLHYFPPETILRGEYQAIPATVWSVGILLFHMVWGDVPFSDDNEIVKGTLHFPRDISRECRNLIRRCLTSCPSNRPTMEDILLHPWMKQIGK